MKLTLLGNNGPYPCADGACSGYLLRSDSGRTNLLIDCGTGVLAKLSKHLPWDALDAVILSHLHFDHMSDMLPMQYALQFHPRSEALPVYAPLTPAPVRALLNVPAYALHPMEDAQIGEFSVRFFRGRHPVESHAMRIECDGAVFVYTGDTNEIENLDRFAENADLLLADAGLSSADWKPTAPHLCAAGCGHLARSARAHRLLLTHLNPKYLPASLADEARTEFANVEIATIGAEYAI